MRSLNPDHLRALAEVVAQGSFTRAAKRLNLAQPTISLQIRELETRLGVRLVDRMGKRAFADRRRPRADRARPAHLRGDRPASLQRCGATATAGSARCASAPAPSALIYHLPPVLARLRKSIPTSSWW